MKARSPARISWFGRDSRRTHREQGAARTRTAGKSKGDADRPSGAGMDERRAIR